MTAQTLPGINYVTMGFELPLGGFSTSDLGTGPSGTNR